MLACSTTFAFFGSVLIVFGVFVLGGLLSFARWLLGALLFGDGLLVANLIFVELIFAEDTVECRDSSDLLQVLHALFFSLVLVLNLHAVDCIQLVQFPDATFYQFN